MKIRAAIPAEKDQICNVLRRSIAELCTADHAGDPARLDPWLFNKTPENVLAWMNDPTARMLVAVDGTTILGIGSANASGEITLNYVSPDARFRGVSKAILGELENYLREQGNSVSKLTSTSTAHGFYKACGYSDNGPARKHRQINAQPMEKQL